jgi:hypothetical protein
LGIILGQPTGLSGKLWTGKTTAFDAGAAWSLAGDEYFQVHGDFLFHNFNLFKVDSGQMALFYGFGGRLAIFENAEDRVSIRVPVGISYEFAKTSIELFLEVVPMLDILPETVADIGGGVGFRYFF